MVLTGFFIIILAGMALGAVREIAKALASRGASTADLAKLKQQLDQLTTELEEVRADLSTQAAQFTELQERLDFAERLLAQSRDRALGAGHNRS